MPGFIQSVLATTEGEETSSTSVDSTISAKLPIITTRHVDFHGSVMVGFDSPSPLPFHWSGKVVLYLFLSAVFDNFVPQ